MMPQGFVIDDYLPVPALPENIKLLSFTNTLAYCTFLSIVPERILYYRQQWPIFASRIVPAAAIGVTKYIIIIVMN